LELVKGGCNVAWHGQVDGAFDIVPFECYSTVEFSSPIFSDAVVFADAVAEMISVLLADIFDSKIIDHEGKFNGAPFVTPEPGCVTTLEVSFGFQSFSEELVGEDASLGKAVHATSNFDVDVTIVDQFAC